MPNPKSATWRAAVELKWWSGANKVKESLWDAYKVAALYSANKTDAAYLVAAGPAQLWAQPLAGLFERDTHLEYSGLSHGPSRCI